MTDDFKTVTPTDDGLGHSDRELKRLEQLELLIGPFTRRSFHEAGIGPGLYVLEIGSGASDASSHRDSSSD